MPRNPQLRFHVLGSPQLEDEIVYRDDANPGNTFMASVTEDGAFIILQVFKTGMTCKVLATHAPCLGHNDDQPNPLQLAFNITVCNDFRSEWE